MKSINNLLSSLKVERVPLFSTVIFFFVSTIIPSHTLLFVISLIYFVFLVFSTKSIQKTIFYSFFPFWLMDVGRVFTYVAVPAWAIFNPIYPNGRIISFTFSPFFIISITTIIVLYVLVISKLFKRKNKQSPKNSDIKVFGNLYLVFFLITFALFFFSSSLANFFPGLSLLYTTTEFSFLAWLIITIMYFRNASKKNVSQMLITFFFILFFMLVFEAGITYVQFIKRGVIGLTIEKYTTIPTFGFGVDEDQTSFRPIGLSYHANSLANWQVTLLSSLILIWLIIKDLLPKRISNFMIISSAILSVSIIILTISRSAYLSLGIFLLILLILNYNSTIKGLKFCLRYFNKSKIPILLIGIFFIYLISNRAYYSIFSLSDTGGLTTRGSQISDAIQLIYRSPLLGVGNGMYISALYNFNPLGFIRFFPEYVHDGFILFVAERGFLPVFAYLAGLYFLFKATNKSNFSKTIKVTIVAGFLAVYSMMLFQPFVNLFSLNILITCILLDTKIHAKILPKEQVL